MMDRQTDAREKQYVSQPLQAGDIILKLSAHGGTLRQMVHQTDLWMEGQSNTPEGIPHYNIIFLVTAGFKNNQRTSAPQKRR